MTVSLGGITLNNDLRLTGLRASRISVDQQFTIGGSSVVQIGQKYGGRELKLEGYFRVSQIDTIKELEELGYPVELIHPRATLQVIIVNTPVEDWVDWVEQDPEDYEIGSIELIEV